jgi:hypothetical protein
MVSVDSFYVTKHVSHSDDLAISDRLGLRRIVEMSLD